MEFPLLPTVLFEQPTKSIPICQLRGRCIYKVWKLWGREAVGQTQESVLWVGSLSALSGTQLSSWLPAATWLGTALLWPRRVPVHWLSLGHSNVILLSDSMKLNKQTKKNTLQCNAKPGAKTRLRGGHPRLESPVGAACSHLEGGLCTALTSPPELGVKKASCF